MMQKKVVFVQFGIASMSAPHCSFSADTGANAKSYKKAVLHIKAKLDFGLSLISTILQYSMFVDMSIVDFKNNYSN